ncbi:hypothetical protein L1049_018917 [Liquidambar formosana]|uniref:(+)-neomenthol dehydrogenase-like n=1 Tax=Liquidambar formosana TaxID=63359 RepID=A0AAP0WMY4_LIQFO
MVVLTARDEKKGIEAVEKLKGSGLSDHVVFHQLDVGDPATIVNLADFIKTQFGKLDILVNNAGINGVILDGDAMTRAAVNGWPQTNWDEITTETSELAEDCLKTNYYGAKGMIEALVPLLHLSDSARIVNVSSSLGKLENIPSGWAKGVFSDVENLTEARVDEVLNEFLKDFKEGLLETKGWPCYLSAYTISKAAMNAYTRILAKKYTAFYINCICPGFVRTDITANTGQFTAEEGAESVVRLALMPTGGPSGLFFYRKEVSTFG